MLASPPPTRARVGLIIPSSNRNTEPQFNRFGPPGVQYHVTRLRMTGPQHKPMTELLPQIGDAAAALGDAKCDLIVFHCTANSMESGLETERQIVETMQQASGRPATSTGGAALKAFEVFGARRLALITPYPAATNQREIEFLAEAGLDVIRNRPLDLGGSDQYLAAPPSLWAQITREEADPEVDAYFLSCTATNSIEVIEELEQSLDRPVITSNQAVIWYSARSCGVDDRLPGLGRLLQKDLPTPVAV
jgi:maleate isomerase